MTYIGLSIIGVVYLSLWALVRQNKKNEAKIAHDLAMKLERNEQVRLFRERMYYMLPIYVDKCMPSYAEMLRSDVPLTAKNWVDVDKLTNSDYVGNKRMLRGEFAPMHGILIEFNAN